MKKIMISNQRTQQLITSNASIAKSFFSRFIGLMGRKEVESDYCLIIEPCNQIHMMNMRFSIDVIYLNRDNKVIAMDKNIKPWSIGKKQAQACKVIESRAGFLSKNIKIDDTLVFKQVK